MSLPCAILQKHFKRFIYIQRGLFQVFECYPLFRLTYEYPNCCYQPKSLVSACPVVPQSSCSNNSAPRQVEAARRNLWWDSAAILLSSLCCGARGTWLPFCPLGLKQLEEPLFTLHVVGRNWGRQRHTERLVRVGQLGGWVIFPPLPSSNAKHMGRWKRWDG